MSFTMTFIKELQTHVYILQAGLKPNKKDKERNAIVFYREV